MISLPVVSSAENSSGPCLEMPAVVPRVVPRIVVMLMSSTSGTRWSAITRSARFGPALWPFAKLMVMLMVAKRWAYIDIRGDDREHCCVPWSRISIVGLDGDGKVETLLVVAKSFISMRPRHNALSIEDGRETATSSVAMQLFLPRQAGTIRGFRIWLPVR